MAPGTETVEHCDKILMVDGQPVSRTVGMGLDDGKLVAFPFIPSFDTKDDKESTRSPSPLFEAPVFPPIPADDPLLRPFAPPVFPRFRLPEAPAPPPLPSAPPVQQQQQQQQPVQPAQVESKP